MARSVECDIPESLINELGAQQYQVRHGQAWGAWGMLWGHCGSGRNCRPPGPAAAPVRLTRRLAAAQRVGAAPPVIIPPRPAFALPQVELTRLLSSGRMDYNTVQQLATPELVRGERTCA